MYQLRRSVYTETAHLLRDHPGLCKNWHGHSYKITVVIQSPLLVNDMVMDFHELKDIMYNTVEAVYDHTLVVDEETWKEFSSFLKTFPKVRVVITQNRPTAEHMAESIFKSTKRLLPKQVELVRVHVRETRNNEAIYYEE